jgi:hypothetical protein
MVNAGLALAGVGVAIARAGRKSICGLSQQTEFALNE